MKKKIAFSLSLILLFILLISAQLHRPIFADECPLSCPISGPLTGPITGPSDNPTATPTVTPTEIPSVVPSISIEPSATDTPTPSQSEPTPSVSTPTPTPMKNHHGDFGRIFQRFLAFEALWKQFLQLFSQFNHVQNPHVSLNSHLRVLGISSEVRYIADNTCADEKRKTYSRFDL